MAFHEVRFPVNIQPGTTGGPEFSTRVTIVGNGDEVRVRTWSHSRLSYDIGYIGNPTDVAIVSSFFRGRGGRVNGWRFKDWSDYSAVDEPMVNDGTTHLQLIKTYGDAYGSEVRTIMKPVAGTITLKKNGVAMPTGWTIDNTTGIITLAVSAPGSTFVWSGQFDVPVRFKDDKLNFVQESVGKYSIATLPIIEVFK